MYHSVLNNTSFDLTNMDKPCLYQQYKQDSSYYMTDPKKKRAPQKNKNNKTKPENLMKKEYLESLKDLKKDIKEE